MANLVFNSTRFAVPGATMNAVRTFIKVHNKDNSSTDLRELPLHSSKLKDGATVPNGAFVQLITVHVADEHEAHYFAEVRYEAKGAEPFQGWIYEKNLPTLCDENHVDAEMKNSNGNRKTELRKFAKKICKEKTGAVPDGGKVRLLEINRADDEGKWYMAKVGYIDSTGVKCIGWVYECHVVGLCRQTGMPLGGISTSIFDKPILISCKFDDFNLSQVPKTTALKQAQGWTAGGAPALAGAKAAAAARTEAPNADRAFHELGGTQAQHMQMLLYPNLVNYPRQCMPSCGGLGDKCKTLGLCWRGAFRTHLRRIKRAGGRMLQVIDGGALGAGQKEEVQWAEEEGIVIWHWDGTLPFVLNVKDGKWTAPP